MCEEVRLYRGRHARHTADASPSPSTRSSPEHTATIQAIVEHRSQRLRSREWSLKASGGGANTERASLNPPPIWRRREGPRRRDRNLKGWSALERRSLLLVGRPLQRVPRRRQSRHLEGRTRYQPAHALRDPFLRPLFGGQEVSSGFSGTFSDDTAEVFGTMLVGKRSLSFRGVLKRLVEE